MNTNFYLWLILPTSGGDQEGCGVVDSDNFGMWARTRQSLGGRYRSSACVFIEMLTVCWGIEGPLEHAGGWKGDWFLVLSRLDEKLVNKLLKVSKMKTPDFRNINGIICLADPKPIDKCRYLGNNWAGTYRNTFCQSWSSWAGMSSPFSPELKVLSACSSCLFQKEE